jgi:hypothetical protein
MDQAMRLCLLGSALVSQLIDANSFDVQDAHIEHIALTDVYSRCCVFFSGASPAVTPCHAPGLLCYNSITLRRKALSI